MKTLVLLLSGILSFTLNTAFAGDTPRGSTPRGNLLELHSCELFAGGCTVSSESPQDGRYMLRVWEFTEGTFDKIDLKGLQVAVLQTSQDNLAAKDSKSGDAVVYLPQFATDSQRDALLAWVKSSHSDFKPAKIQTRIAHLQLAKSDKGYSFSAGDFISVKASAPESCDALGCGEELWYQPRATTSLFTVAVNRGSQVTEPLLKLSWSDSSKYSVFLARFGEANPSKNIYVTMTELCGPTKF